MIAIHYDAKVQKFTKFNEISKFLRLFLNTNYCNLWNWIFLLMNFCLHYRYRGNAASFITVTAGNRWQRNPLPRYRGNFFILQPHYRGNYRENAVITAVNRPVSLSTVDCVNLGGYACAVLETLLLDRPSWKLNLSERRANPTNQTNSRALHSEQGAHVWTFS